MFLPGVKSQSYDAAQSLDCGRMLGGTKRHADGFSEVEKAKRVAVGGDYHSHGASSPKSHPTRRSATAR
jgi:hypothetical protein